MNPLADIDAMNFEERVVVLTGAAGNLGCAVAHAFRERGARLVLLDRHVEPSSESLAVHPTSEMRLTVDLTDASQVAYAVSNVIGQFSRIDVLCNLAGGFRMGDAVHETDPETWRFLFDLNARSVLNTATAVVPHMLAAGRGKIVNVGAFAAQRGMAQMGAYVASKAAVVRLTESMAAELRERNINVNCVLPTILDTPENRAAMPNNDPSRWVSPEDLAHVILFLASGHARAVHGAAIPVTALS